MKNPLPGRMYLDHNFPFRDGTSKPKYVVVLTAHAENLDWYYVVPTTSGEKSDCIAGCHLKWPECFYLPDNENPIGSQSWIMLDDVYNADFEILKRKCKYIGDISLETTKSILICGSKSGSIPIEVCELFESEASLILC